MRDSAMGRRVNGGMSEAYQQTFVPLKRAAHRLGLPVAFLVGEARAGRIPVLRAGRRILVNLQVVADALVERARAKGVRHAR